MGVFLNEKNIRSFMTKGVGINYHQAKYLRVIKNKYSELTAGWINSLEGKLITNKDYMILLKLRDMDKKERKEYFKKLPEIEMYDNEDDYFCEYPEDLNHV